MAGIDYKQLLYDEVHGILFAQLEQAADAPKIFQLALEDIKTFQYTKVLWQESLILEFSEGFMDKICKAWISHRGVENLIEEDES